MNRNPVKARLAQRRRRKPGDLHALTRALWGAIGDVELALVEATTNDERCRAAHAMAACCNAYVKLLAVGEYEARLARIEQWMEISAHAPLLPADATGLGRVSDRGPDDHRSPDQGPQWQ